MVFARRQMAAIAQSGVEVRIFFLSSRTSLRTLARESRRFRSAVREFEPDIVHAHYGTVTALFAAATTTCPLVVSFRGSDINPTSDTSYIRSLFARLFSQIAAVRAQHIICVSEEIRSRIWLPVRPSSIIFDGVNLSSFYPISRDEARSKLGWSKTKKFIFFNLSGRPSGKRLSLAESAVDYVRREISDVELVAVSKVDPERIPLIMNACDCLLLTSDWEGSPTVVKEAMACELPVISVDVGDVRMLLDGVSPSRIVPAEVAAIGSALVDVLCMEVRSNGAERAKIMSEATTTSRLLGVYQLVMSQANHHYEAQTQRQEA
nr:glycosyltransferase family 4 protein [Microvirga splendida]